MEAVQAPGSRFLRGRRQLLCLLLLQLLAPIHGQRHRPPPVPILGPPQQRPLQLLPTLIPGLHLLLELLLLMLTHGQHLRPLQAQLLLPLLLTMVTLPLLLLLLGKLGVPR